MQGKSYPNILYVDCNFVNWSIPVPGVLLCFFCHEDTKVIDADSYLTISGWPRQAGMKNCLIYTVRKVHRPDYFSPSASHTTLNPIPLISENHQILFGCWGSVLSQLAVWVKSLAADLNSPASER